MMPPELTSTPKLRPSPEAEACFWRSLLRTSVASKPELSQSWRGITSSALAKALMKSCDLPGMERAWSRRKRESSMSMAPPPGTMAAFLMARRTIMIASWSERSASSMNCSAPPRSTMVAVFASGQPVKMLKRSFPTWRSSKRPHVPSTPGTRLFTVVWSCAPVALSTRCMSPSSTRPAQKMPRSAKNCVPRSPIARRERTMSAPLSTHFWSFS
mmetsp:Transcript_15394/g.50577  ORF Transcript_15394/g.50577 Transcript_15394/m.50577 type:complete len:214 (+) Transcript_15394:290-931(+)